MEFERSIFKLYDFAVRRLKVVSSLLLLTILIITTYKTVIRLTYAFTSNNDYFANCMNKYYEQYKPNQGEFISQNVLLTIAITMTENQQQCSITSGEQSANEGLYIFADQALFRLPSEIKENHNVTQILIKMNINKLANQYVYEQFGINPILIDKLANQMVRSQIKQILLDEFSKNVYGTITMKNSEKSTSFIKKIFFKLTNVFYVCYKIIFGSTFCGLFVLLILISLQGIHIAFIEILRLFIPSAASMIQFPWLENHLSLLRNSPRLKNKVVSIIFGFICTGMLITFGLSGFIKLAGDSIIGAYYYELNRSGIFLLCLLQLLSLVFLRTRTSIKFVPSLVAVIYLIFYYLQCAYHYNLPQYYIEMPFYMSLSVIILFVIFIESAVAELPDALVYKPTFDRPRCLYFPSYNLGWHDNIPPFWTYFVPLHPRQFFNINQLSYVDKDYPRLYSLLLGLAQPVPLPLSDRQNNQQPEELMMI